MSRLCIARCGTLRLRSLPSNLVLSVVAVHLVDLSLSSPPSRTFYELQVGLHSVLSRFLLAAGKFSGAPNVVCVRVSFSGSTVTRLTCVPRSSVPLLPSLKMAALIGLLMTILSVRLCNSCSSCAFSSSHVERIRMTPSFRSVDGVRLPLLACCRFETLIFVTFGLGFGPASSRGVRALNPRVVRLQLQSEPLVYNVRLRLTHYFSCSTPASCSLYSCSFVHSFSQIRRA